MFLKNGSSVSWMCEHIEIQFADVKCRDFVLICANTMVKCYFMQSVDSADAL